MKNYTKQVLKFAQDHQIISHNDIPEVEKSFEKNLNGVGILFNELNDNLVFLAKDCQVQIGYDFLEVWEKVL